jgi:UDP-N-acetylmuramoyl-tripeptide--D-alanyl-D-alanine ligase
MSFWTPNSVRAAVGGAWVARGSSGVETPIAGISTDTRSLARGDAFFALRGERFDAHDFLHQAIAGGASLLVIDDPSAFSHDMARMAPSVSVLRVPDVLAALDRLAAAHRKKLTGTKVVAVTGSNGKTTTVRLIDAVLRTRLTGTASVKSYNNSIGLALTVLRAKPSDQYLICEAGINDRGEMAPLAAIAEPDIVVITSIGRAHIGQLGSLEGVAREKAVLLSYLRPGGLAVVPADTSVLDEFVRPVPNVLRFGRSAGADLRVTACAHSADGSGLEFEVNGRTRFTLPMLGEHNALNAMAAIAVARRFNLDDDAIRAGLAAAQPAEMRMTRSRVGEGGSIDLYNDAYNASPESTLAAIRAFADVSRRNARRVIVLGDMLELGEHSHAAHTEVAEALIAAGAPDVLVTIGPGALVIADAITHAAPRCRVIILSDLDDAQAVRVAQRIQPGDAVLLKGSRRMGLERIDRALRRAPGASASGSADGSRLSIAG